MGKERRNKQPSASDMKVLVSKIYNNLNVVQTGLHIGAHFVEYKPKKKQRNPASAGFTFKCWCIHLNFTSYYSC